MARVHDRSKETIQKMIGFVVQAVYKIVKGEKEVKLFAVIHIWFIFHILP